MLTQYNVAVWNVRLDIGCPDWDFLFVFLNHYRQMPGKYLYLKLCYDHSVHIVPTLLKSRKILKDFALTSHATVEWLTLLLCNREFPDKHINQETRLSYCVSFPSTLRPVVCRCLQPCGAAINVAPWCHLSFSKYEWSSELLNTTLWNLILGILFSYFKHTLLNTPKNVLSKQHSENDKFSIFNNSCALS